MGLGLEGRVGFKEAEVLAVVNGKLGGGVEMGVVQAGRLELRMGEAEHSWQERVGSLLWGTLNTTWGTLIF